jgi:hypothetical protein
LASKYKLIICTLRNYNFISREKVEPGPGFEPQTIAKVILQETKSVKKVRIQLSQGKQWMLGTRNQLGGRTSSREGIITDATSLFKNVYSSTLPNTNVRYSHPVEEEVPDIMYSEVRSTIADLRNGKTPGEDGIWNQDMK